MRKFTNIYIKFTKDAKYPNHTKYAKHVKCLKCAKYNIHKIHQSMMFVCLSVTARKGTTTFVNLLFVASTFGLKPVSSTDKISKKSQQDSK